MASYVDRLYDNVLGRDGEAEGFNFWLSELISGRRGMAEVLALFSESAENVALVAPSLSEGVFL